MVALTRDDLLTESVVSGHGKPGDHSDATKAFKKGGGRGFRWTAFVIVGLYFATPLAASARYSFLGNHGRFSFSAYARAFATSELWSSLARSAEIGIATVAVTLILLLGTSLWVNLRAERWRPIVEAVTLVPLVVPVVVIVLGILGTLRFLPGFIVRTPAILVLEYVILAMPYTYRIIDNGVRALDLRTLVDAGRSLGGSWRQVVMGVLLPNMRVSLMSAAFMSFAFVLGEYVMASLLSFNTFPVWLQLMGQNHSTEAVALSVIALVGASLVLSTISFFILKKPKGSGAHIARKALNAAR